MLSRIHTTTHTTQLGIGAGIAAGAFWGLVFLAPELVPGFTPLQLSAGRYLAYGIVAALLVARAWPRLRHSLTDFWKSEPREPTLFHKRLRSN